jgi:MHS family proline/betaine transporter-like MFS transporter
MMVNVGLGLASLLSLVLQATLSKEAMLEWGWRVPFLAAGVTAIIG